MNSDKLFLHKLISPKNKEEIVSWYEDTLFYLYKTLGYEETLKLPIPVFIGLIKFINKTECKQEKGFKFENGRK